MTKRYIVKVVDTEGVVWLNTGSFETANKRYLLQAIGRVITKAKALNWSDTFFTDEILEREIFKEADKVKRETCELCGVYYLSYKAGPGNSFVIDKHTKACSHAD